MVRGSLLEERMGRLGFGMRGVSRVLARVEHGQSGSRRERCSGDDTLSQQRDAAPHAPFVSFRISGGIL